MLLLFLYTPRCCSSLLLCTTTSQTSCTSRWSWCWTKWICVLLRWWSPGNTTWCHSSLIYKWCVSPLTPENPAAQVRRREERLSGTRDISFCLIFSNCKHCWIKTGLFGLIWHLKLIFLCLQFFRRGEWGAKLPGGRLVVLLISWKLVKRSQREEVILHN